MPCPACGKMWKIRATGATYSCVRRMTWADGAHAATSLGSGTTRIPMSTATDSKYNNISSVARALTHTHTAHTSPVTGLLSCASLNLKSFRKHTRNVRYLSWNIRQVGTYVRGTTAARASYRARVCVRSTWPKNVSRTITFFGACWMAYLRSLRVFEHNAPLPTCACHTMRCETEWAAPSKMIDIFRLSSEFLDLFALV